MARAKDPDYLGLPRRPFLYTLDQISTLLAVPEEALKRDYLYFAGRTIGAQRPGTIEAVNIAPPDKPVEWRVTERELVRWMRHRGIRIYERTWP